MPISLSMEEEVGKTWSYGPWRTQNSQRLQSCIDRWMAVMHDIRRPYPPFAANATGQGDVVSRPGTRNTTSGNIAEREAKVKKDGVGVSPSQVWKRLTATGYLSKPSEQRPPTCEEPRNQRWWTLAARGRNVGSEPCWPLELVPAVLGVPGPGTWRLGFADIG
ncbi:hypothetical protein QR685DRAFT_573280 [Neurospora intermedia]|uniref:Uncharacterized protein n=1 Tax=Neurospora intermedia TaxID=5142 RepID=A0ABR3DBC2_NEUIN